MLPYSIEEVRGIIESKNCYLLSRAYLNRHTKLKLGCFECGLKWMTNLKQLLERQNACKICGSNTTQFKLYEIIRKEYDDALMNYRGFDWLRTKHGLQELDIYVPSMLLAIEYDGEQHFRPVCFGGISLKRAQANLAQTKRLDRRKNRCVREHPQDVKWFVRFNYRETITTEYVFDKLTKNGVGDECIY